MGSIVGAQKIKHTFYVTEINECENEPCGPNTDCLDLDGVHSCCCKTGYVEVNGKKSDPYDKSVGCKGKVLFSPSCECPFLKKY